MECWCGIFKASLINVCYFFVVQKLGGNAMLVDAEHAFDPSYSKALGVDIENLIVCQPDNGEMALESNVPKPTCKGYIVYM